MGFIALVGFKNKGSWWIYAINIRWINAFFRQAQEGWVYSEIIFNAS